MNNERRKRIDEVKTQLEACLEAVNELRDEEQEAFDGLPESFQQADRGQAMETAISALETAAGNIENAMSDLEEAVGG